jgi:N-acetyl-gamma-glutamyl-phosphate reductase
VIRVGVYGASGYTGFELITLLRRHPKVEICFATSENYAGRSLRDVFPVDWDVPLIPQAEADPGRVEAVFCCLPHGTSMGVVAAARAAQARVIDLSADFRLDDVATYQAWYQVQHSAPDLLPEAEYGLTEVYRSEISQTDLVACPGCYPTSVLLPLYPLLKECFVGAGPIIADSKSGISGAGRKPSLTTHFVEASHNFSPYSIGRSHRHQPEMVQEIDKWGGPGEALIFSPHLLPVRRGLLSTVYVPVQPELSQAKLQSLFEQTYAGEPFVRILPAGKLATLAHALQTNLCVLSLTLAGPGQAIICSAIDNLLKGAAGQALQNFNVMFGVEEMTALI